jgi:hypothetical protein
MLALAAAGWHPVLMCGALSQKSIWFVLALAAASVNGTQQFRSPCCTTWSGKEKSKRCGIVKCTVLCFASDIDRGA